MLVLPRLVLPCSIMHHCFGDRINLEHFLVHLGLDLGLGLGIGLGLGLGYVLFSCLLLYLSICLLSVNQFIYLPAYQSH
jgi:hypothetical protein